MLQATSQSLWRSRQASHICHSTGKSSKARTISTPDGAGHDTAGRRNSRPPNHSSSNSSSSGNSTPGSTDAPSWANASRRNSRPHGSASTSRPAAPNTGQRQSSGGNGSTSSSRPPSRAPAAPQQQQQQARMRNATAADAEVTARKNPGLYSLIGSENGQSSQPAAAAPVQHANAAPQKQQQQQQQSDLVIPWLPSTAGSVGSTGSFRAPEEDSLELAGSTAAGAAACINTALTAAPHNTSSSSISTVAGPSPGPQQQQGGAAAAAAAAATTNGQQQQQRRMTNRPLTKPEVLSPAGGWPQLRAAVENGADAVYFGCTGFNARARAANFDPSELPAVMSYLHERGVKGYVALNILVFDEELSRLEVLMRQLAGAGVDAVIVQDVGAVSLIRSVAPHLPIHGSTQMSITTAEGAEFAASLGVSRVVVGRELSVADIAKVSSNTRVEVEAFCHGALCVSYSGQCYSSEAWGGRSANRGQCAQACRMPYGLIVDGQIKDLADISYLLSPQDLMALEQLPAMVAAGVGCFKIEGRLKGPEYVAATTAAYRAGVDAAWELLQQEQQQEQQRQQQERLASNSTASTSSSTSSSSSPSSFAKPQLNPELLNNLAQVFSRGQDESHSGLTPGFLEGSKHQRLVRGRAPRHRGLCLGRVTGFTDRGVIVEGLLNPVKRGDGLVFDQGSPEVEEEGGSVWDIMQIAKVKPQGGGSGSSSSSSSSSSRRGSSRGGGRSGSSSSSSSGRKVEGEAPAGSSVELLFGPGQVNLGRLSAGALVWKSRDPALESALRDSYEAVSSTTARKLPVQVFVSGALGSPLQLQLTDPDGNTTTADTGHVLLQAAAKRPMSTADVVAAVGQLGDNSLAPSGIDVSGLELEQGLFLPASAFKAVRRAAAEQLLALRLQHSYDWDLAKQPVLPDMLAAAAAAAAASTSGSSSSSSTSHSNTSGSSSSGSSSSSTLHSSSNGRAASQPSTALPSLRVLCRTPGQVQAALKLPWLTEIIVDFLEVHGLKEAVAAVQGAGKQAVVALPRILKPDESRLLWFYLKLRADALLLRGAGCLQQLLELGGSGAVVHGIAALGSSSSSGSSNGSGSGSSTDAAAGAAAAAAGQVVIPRLEGDFSLNAANVLAADLLLKSGLSRLCPTHDLNAGQLAVLAQGLGPAGQAGAGRAVQLEAVVHQHLPIFHTEHCVFCRFLSEGDNYLNCGHPCEQHKVHLRDSAGADHLVLADMGCRNTVFNASAQSGLYYLPRLAAAGYGTLRVELVDESAEVVGELLEGYRGVLEGRVRPGEVWEWMRGVCEGGVGAGSLEVKSERAVASLRPTARRS